MYVGSDADVTLAFISRDWDDVGTCPRRHAGHYWIEERRSSPAVMERSLRDPKRNGFEG